MRLLLPAAFVASPGARDEAWNLHDSLLYTRWLARTHYENFHVVSWLLPRRLHQDFFNVYAFCRWADDLGDEIGDPVRSLQLLDWWRQELDRLFEGEAGHPVYVALRQTVLRHSLPKEPFADLIRAFVQDQTVTRYHTYAQLLDYCQYSANPVGRLVLHLCGYTDAERRRLSDATCTALQLANFWQDVARDLAKGRIYIPADLMAGHGYGPEDLEQLRFNGNFRDLMCDLVDRAQKLFLEGLLLAEMVDRRLAVDIELFSRGGMAILEKIRAQDYNVLAQRPALTKSDRVGLMVRVVARQVARPAPPDVARSQAHCRRVTRRAARNFYYAFLPLSREQHNAMCAVYAFARSIDDVTDEPAVDGRRESIERLRRDLEAALDGGATTNRVLPALRHAVRRFAIPRRHLFELVDGVSVDLDLSRCSTFDELYRYCYGVASTVGLICLHIFGFSSPDALPLAEQLGVAFQLTNILRDLREDAARGRLYLPEEDLERFGVARADLEAGRLDRVRGLLRFEADRAEQYYQEAAPLLALVHRRSRASLWIMTAIYHGILERVRASDYDVFSRRAGLTTAEKIAIMLHGVKLHLTGGAAPFPA